MHSWDKKEAASLKALLSFSEVPYSSADAGPVTNHPAEATCGWKSARPCAEYDTAAKVSRKRTTKFPAAPNHNPPRTGLSQDGGTDTSYMTGRLDEGFSYTYPGGLRASIPKYGALYNSQNPIPQPTYRRQIVSLNPVIPFRSSQLDPNAHTELATIMAMQMKPELLIEQIIIENRLRTMSLNAFPILGIGPGINNTSHMKLPPKSFSSPSLPQHRKHKRRKFRPAPAPKPQMEWCPLASTGSRAELLLPFNSKQSQYPPGFLGISGVASNSKQSQYPPGFLGISGVASNSKASVFSKRADSLRKAGLSSHSAMVPMEQGSDAAYPVPVVSPSLEAGDMSAVKATRQHVKQKRMNPRVY